MPRSTLPPNLNEQLDRLTARVERLERQTTLKPQAAAAGSGAFPIVYDDGTYTYEVAAGADPTGEGSSNVLSIAAWKDSDPTKYTVMQVTADDSLGYVTLDSKVLPVNIRSNFDINLVSTVETNINAGASIALHATNGIDIRSTGSPWITLAPFAILTTDGSNQPLLQIDKSTSAFGNSPASSAFIWVRDNGGGKMQLVARFPSGAVQVIATEP